MRQFYVYIHTEPDGTPFYVGKGTRARAYNFNARNTFHRSIVKKHGTTNIGVLIFYCETESDAFAVEIEYIRQLREAGIYLANLCDGGEGSFGVRRSAETRAKMAAYNLNRPIEHTRKIAEALKGKTHSAETRAKLSRLAKERQDPNPMEGRRHTPESIAKMVAARKANPAKSRDGVTGRFT